MDTAQYVKELRDARNSLRKAVRGAFVHPPREVRAASKPIRSHRNIAILAEAAEGVSFAEIGRKHGITRERARQIVTRLGGEPKRLAIK